MFGLQIKESTILSIQNLQGGYFSQGIRSSGMPKVFILRLQKAIDFAIGNPETEQQSKNKNNVSD